MRLALALSLLPALPAGAAIDPCHLDRMVAEAYWVVQLTGQTVVGPDAEGTCTLAGTVVRSFEGGASEGASLKTTFACANPRGLVGGTVYHDPAEIEAAGAIELHASADLSPAGNGWGLLLLEAPTEEPAFPFENLGGC